MDKQIKDKWLKALRSGRYKQGTGTLVDDTGMYCCLGVLARVQGAKTEDMRSNSYLQNDLAKYKAGLRIASQNILAKMNDGVDYRGAFIGKKSFKEIADYIEKKYK
jgi:hypothetical protein